MTLADFVRSFLEKRRKRIEELYGCDNECSGKNTSSFIATDANLDGRVSVSDVSDFFEDKEANATVNGKIELLSDDRGAEKRNHFGMTHSSRVVTLPDGTRQIETVSKDHLGNTIHRTVYKKGDKIYTVIKKTDIFGNERVEENVQNTSEGYFGNRDIVSDAFGQPFGSDQSGFDFWFDKLFRKKDGTSSSEIPPSNSFPTNIEQQIENMLKNLGIDKVPESSETPWNSGPGPNSPPFPDMKSIIDEFFNNGEKFNNGGGFVDDTRKFIEPDNDIPIQKPVQKKQRQSIVRNDEIQDKIAKAFNSGYDAGNKNGIFASMYDRARLIGIPEPKCHLNYFIQPDEDQQKRYELMLQDVQKYIKQLEDYLSDPSPKKSGDSLKYITKSFVPKLEEPAPVTRTPKHIKKKKQANTSVDKSRVKAKATRVTRTEMHLSGGRTRTETISRDTNGVEERVVVYKIGNKAYTVNTRTDANGKKKQTTTVNVSEEDLQAFKEAWGDAFRSDFED